VGTISAHEDITLLRPKLVNAQLLHKTESALFVMSSAVVVLTEAPQMINSFLRRTRQRTEQSQGLLRWVLSWVPSIG